MDYPIDFENYNTEEIIDIIDFLSLIEAMNASFDERKISLLKDKHKRYLSILNNQSEAKRIDKAFQAQTGISIYKFMKNITD